MRSRFHPNAVRHTTCTHEASAEAVCTYDRVSCRSWRTNIDRIHFRLLCFARLRLQSHHEHQTRTTDRLKGLEAAVLATLGRMDMIADASGRAQQQQQQHRRTRPA